MKTTHAQVRQAVPALELLSRTQELHWRPAMEIRKALRVLRPIAGDIEAERQKYLDEFAELAAGKRVEEPIAGDPLGRTRVRLRDEAAFNAKFNGLLEGEVEVDVEPLSMGLLLTGKTDEEIDRMRFAPGTLEDLGDFFSDELPGGAKEPRRSPKRRRKAGD